MALSTFLLFLTNSMKKILLIDDGDNGRRIDFWAKRIASNETLVALSSSHHTFFSVDESGNDHKLLFDKEDFEFVFFHDSQGADRQLPSNVIDSLRMDLLKNQLVRFSGSLVTSLASKTIAREDLEKNFADFISTSKTLEEWVLPVAYGHNYKAILREKILKNLENDISVSNLLETKEVKDLFKLNQIKEGSGKYIQVGRMTPLEFSNELYNLS
jgi:hypothetical protein